MSSLPAAKFPARLDPLAAFDRVFKESGDPLESGSTRALVDALVRDALRERASDVHFLPRRDQYEIRFRTDGELRAVGAVPQPLGHRLIRTCKSMADLDPAAAFTPTDGRAEFTSAEAGVNVRLALAPTVQGEKMTLRLLRPDRERMDLSSLGLSGPDLKAIRRAMDDSEGMLLVSSPTGSGKTTTLYALLSEFRTRGYGVVSIEDPVECVLDGVAQIEVNERVGLTFNEGLKGVLRLDPDVIAMGEMRDQNSAKSAVDAADSGHVVVSTLHARDAVGTITSLRNFGLRNHEIAASLDLVVAQRLVRRLCAKCRQRGALTDEDGEWLRHFGQPVPESNWRAAGCQECNMTGYKGRVGVFEVWRLIETDADLILRGADEHAIRRQVRKEGTLSMLDDDLLKVADGLTSLDEIKRLGGLGFYLPR